MKVQYQPPGVPTYLTPCHRPPPWLPIPSSSSPTLLPPSLAHTKYLANSHYPNKCLLIIIGREKFAQRKLRGCWLIKVNSYWKPFPRIKNGQVKIRAVIILRRNGSLISYPKILSNRNLSSRMILIARTKAIINQTPITKFFNSLAVLCDSFGHFLCLFGLEVSAHSIPSFASDCIAQCLKPTHTHIWNTRHIYIFIYVMFM